MTLLTYSNSGDYTSEANGKYVLRVFSLGKPKGSNVSLVLIHQFVKSQVRNISSINHHIKTNISWMCKDFFSLKYLILVDTWTLKYFCSVWNKYCQWLMFLITLLKLILVQMDFDISFPISLTLILSNSLSFSHTISVTSLHSMDLYHLLSLILTHNYNSYFHNYLTPTHTQVTKSDHAFHSIISKGYPT